MPHVAENREELIRRCRAKSRCAPCRLQRQRNWSSACRASSINSSMPCEIISGRTWRFTGAAQHGRDLQLQGFTVSQVVHDYGDVCQSITELAIETGAPISVGDFRILNRCLDDAIASAVTEYGRERPCSVQTSSASASGSSCTRSETW